MNKNRTIFCVFSGVKLDASQVFTYKQYCFNTDHGVKPNDMIKTNSYDQMLVVTHVCDTVYSFFNKSTGELTHKANNTNCYPIRSLTIADDAFGDDNIVFGVITSRAVL